MQTPSTRPERRNTGALSQILTFAFSGVLLGIAHPAHAQYAASVLADNPVAYYRLGELSGTTVVNTAASGATNNAVISGNSVALGQPGAIPTDSTNSAYGFSGDANSFVNIPTSAVDPIRSGFTVEFWFRTTASQTPNAPQWYNGVGLVDGEVSGVTNDFGTAISGGSVLFGIGGPDVTISSASTNLNNGVYHLVDAAWSTSGTMQLYIDGSLQNSLTGVSTGVRNSPNLHIGNLQTGVSGGFIGSIDEVALYDAPLSAVRIQAHFNAATQTVSAAPEPGAILLFMTVGLPVTGDMVRRKYSRCNR